MTTAALLRGLQQQGITLTAEGEQLQIDAPAALLTDDLMEQLRANKPALLSALAPADPARMLKRLAELKITVWIEGEGDPAHLALAGPITDAVQAWVMLHHSELLGTLQDEYLTRCCFAGCAGELIGILPRLGAAYCERHEAQAQRLEATLFSP